jgi:hypothetical protein
MSINRIDVSVKFTDALSQQAFEDAVQASGLTIGQYLLGLLNCELPPLKVNEGFDITNPLASLGIALSNN